MGFKSILVDAILMFSVTLVVTAVVTYLHNIFFKGLVLIDWETSVRLAVIFAIIFPWLNYRKKKAKRRLIKPFSRL